MALDSQAQQAITLWMTIFSFIFVMGVILVWTLVHYLF